MVKKIERVFASHAFEDIRAAYIARSRLESGRVADARAWLAESGYDQMLDVPDDALLTADGREILRVRGNAWALRPEVHAKRLAEAMEQAKQRDDATKQSEQQAAQSALPATCTTLIDGQLCGGSLIQTSVCPRCALGKMGIAATLTCDVCGHVSAIMRSDA